MVLTLETPLISKGTFTEAQVVAAILSQQPRTPYSDAEVRYIVRRTFHWCDVFEFNHDLVTSQEVHETDWFRFTGDVEPWQWNFAGLGATGGVLGHSFPLENGLIHDDGIDAGCLAVVTHHAAYRWGPKENWPPHLQQYAGEHVDPRYSAVLSTGNAGKMIVLGDYRGTWAVPGRTYPESLITRSKQIAAFPRGDEPTMPDRPFHVAISYGHRNTDGGNAIEREQTPKIGAAVVTACRARGIEVYNVHDEVGLNPNLGLQGIARKVVEKHQSGWPVDLYLEVHTEGAGPNARGVFAIYPDTGDDVDLDAKRVGQDAARRIAGAVGIGLRGDGTMSERNTGIGAQGHRLGVFLVTAAIKATTTRMIIEYGSHDNQDDLTAIMGNLPAVGAATADAFTEEAKRLGFQVGSEPVPPAADEPACLVFDETGKKLCHGFRAYWEKWGGLRIFGFPLTDEYIDPETGLTVQYFERARFEWHPGSDPENFDVVLGRIGDELLKVRDAA